MKLYRSQRADTLGDALADVLRVHDGGPFDSDLVVVSGRAPERALRMRVAQRIGICANVRFVSPSTFLEETLARVLGLSAADVQSWRSSRIQWAVLRVLPDLLDDPRFAPVAFYLGEERRPGSARWVALAGHIGDCFARYATARPDDVLAWDAGGGDAGEWQPVLWRAVARVLGERHIATLAKRAIEALDTNSVDHTRLPRRFCWITHPGVAKLNLDVVAALARSGVDAHVFALTPSKNGVHVSPDRDSPLAESLGQQAYNFERLLFQSAQGQIQVRNAFVAPEPDSILHVLQCDVLNGARYGASGFAPLDLDATDRSVRIHACHGRMRQVEVLRDELLRLFDECPGLEPRDVLVLSPAIDEFAPLIDAVFGTTSSRLGVNQIDGESAMPTEPPGIPFRITDRPVLNENRVADALLHVFELAAGRVDAVSVLDFLFTPVVAACFGFTPDVQDTLRRWVRESGIRWGIDAEHRSAHGLPSIHENSWRFGLDRLLVGHAVPTDGRALVLDVLPYDEIEGANAELLGRFAAACEWIFDTIAVVQVARSMPEWRTVLAGIGDALIDDTDTDLAWPLRVMHSTIDTLIADADSVGMTAPVEFDAIALLLRARFAESSVAGGDGNGSVTFAALMPGRPTPARVVALLGLDADVFPRARGGLGFDLLVNDPRVGDTDPGADDRARLLEAIMAAEEHLVITYAGRTLDTNEPVPPAAPVGELLDVIDATFTCSSQNGDVVRRASEIVEVVHPLQPFSPRNFRLSSERVESQSYDRMYLKGAERLLGDRQTPPAFLSSTLPPAMPAEAPVVTLDALARFFSAPVRTLFQTRLQLSLTDRDDKIEIREPIELSGLSAYEARHALVEAVLDERSCENMFPLIRGTGLLPHGANGRIAYDRVAHEASAIAANVQRERVGSPRPPIRLDVEINGIRLVGTIDALWDDVRIVSRLGSVRAAHIVDAWVRHASMHLVPGSNATTVLIGKPSKSAKFKDGVVRLRSIDNARDVVANLLSLYVRGLREPLPFFPETSRAYAESIRNSGDDDDARHKALRVAGKEWMPESETVRELCEAVDPYVTRVFAGWCPGSDARRDADFSVIALQVWQPILEHLVQDGR